MLQHLIKCQTASENDKEKKHKGKNITTHRVPVVTSMHIRCLMPSSVVPNRSYWTRDNFPSDHVCVCWLRDECHRSCFFSVQFGTKSWNHETPSKWNRLHFPKQGRIKVSDYGVVFLILFDENIKSELSLTKIVICNNLIGSSWVWSSDANGVPGQCGQWVSEVMSFYLCLLKEYTLWDRVVTKRERRSVPQPIGPELQAV